MNPTPAIGSPATISHPEQPCLVTDCPHMAQPPDRVCPSCGVKGRRTVQLLVVRWLELRAALAPGAHGSLGPISRQVPSSRAPVSSQALESMERVERLLVASDGLTRSLLGLPARSYAGVRAGVTVVRCQTLLIAQWDRLMTTPVAGRVVDDLLGLRSSVDRVLGLGHLVHRLPAPCPRCDNLTLARYDGDAWVRCLTCGSSWSEDQYRHLVRVLLDESRAAAGSRPQGGAA